MAMSQSIGLDHARASKDIHTDIHALNDIHTIAHTSLIRTVSNYFHLYNPVCVSIASLLLFKFNN